MIELQSKNGMDAAGIRMIKLWKAKYFKEEYLLMK